MNDLHQQLDRASAYDAEFGHNLATHLPMTLTAMQRLGASVQAREAFMARYVQTHGLRPVVPIQVWPVGDAWRERLGDPAAWPVYRGLFREWIAHEGERDVLAQVLPWLMPGVGAAAFHGLLRLAYGLSAEHSGEVADGLAYWACRWFECGAASMGEVADDSAAVMSALMPKKFPQPLIAERMQAAAQTAAFKKAMKGWRVKADVTLPALAKLAAQRYAVSGSFTLLHALTSVQAMSVVLPYIEADQRDEAVAAYAGAFAAAWASTPVVEKAPVAPLVWEQVVRRTLASPDRPDWEHGVKCVDAARQMNRIDAHPCWLAAASRAAVY
jgi:Questin oxidase-like